MINYNKALKILKKAKIKIQNENVFVENSLNRVAARDIISPSNHPSVSSSPSAEPCARTCLCMNVHMFLRRVGTLHSGHVTVRALAPPPPRAELAAINLATQVLSKWCRHLNTVTLLPPRRSKQTAHSALGSLNCAAAAWTNASARLEWSRRWLIASRSLRIPSNGSGSAKVLSEA